jgi:hypothetical protein
MNFPGHNSAPIEFLKSEEYLLYERRTMML